MKKGFWKKLKPPVFGLAPMANVTDIAFRELITKYGKPDVFWTEFVSVEGLLSKGKEVLLTDLKYLENQRPVVAQIFGSKPDQFTEVGKLLTELKFDGVDINMGCPDKNIEKSGAGAALIKDPNLAKNIVIALKKGAPSLPVSVKTRIGYNQSDIQEWTKHLLEMELAAITMHLRTRRELSNVLAHWDVAKQMMEVVGREISKKEDRPMMLGNGDVQDLQHGKKLIKETGLDGVVIGRGVFGNPLLFNKRRGMEDLSVKDKINMLLEHITLFEKHFQGVKNFDVMKKHFKAYVMGFDGAKELRVDLMQVKSKGEVEEILKKFLNTVQ